MSNVNNLTLDQVALVLYQWSLGQTHRFQIGVVLEGHGPYLVPIPSEEGETVIVWIHNDNASALLG